MVQSKIICIYRVENSLRLIHVSQSHADGRVGFGSEGSKRNDYCWRMLALIILLCCNFGRAWLVQLVRSLLSDHKVFSSILGLTEI